MRSGNESQVSEK